jgi:hypothetical protein
MYSLWAKVMASPRFGCLTSSCGQMSSNKIVALVLSRLKLVSMEQTVPYLVKYLKIKCLLFSKKLTFWNCMLSKSGHHSMKGLGK